MSQLHVNEITNGAGDGPPDFPFGASGIFPPIASTAQAEAGTDNETFITPLRMREGFNASGSAPVFACRAWVNFDATTAAADIRESGNVSSVVKNGTGEFTVNFSTAMPDANYSIAGIASRRVEEDGTASTNSMNVAPSVERSATPLQPSLFLVDLPIASSSGGTRRNALFVLISVFR